MFTHWSGGVMFFMCNCAYAPVYDVKILVYCSAQKILVKCSVAQIGCSHWDGGWSPTQWTLHAPHPG